MNAQLSELVRRNNDVWQRVERLVAKYSAEQLNRKAGPERWSAIECIEHLNISAEKMFPLIQSGLAEMAMYPRTEKGPYTMDMIGRLLNWTLKPGSVITMKTPPSFIPATMLDTAPVIEQFTEYHQQFTKLIAEADGLPLGSVKIVSAFNSNVKYNLFSSLTIIVTHAERHLLQAEKAVQ